MYGKIFESIYDGTLAEDWRALITFQQFIVLSDADGIVDMTPQSISRRTGIPIEHIKAGIEILEREDIYSRTADEKGKRIERIDGHRPWGWHIVNHKKYKLMRTAEDRREYMKNYMNDYRKQKSLQEFTEVNSKQELTQLADTDTDTDTDTVIIKTKKFKIPSIQGIQNYLDEKNITSVNAEHFFNHYEANGWIRGKTKIKSWQACVNTWLKNNNDGGSGHATHKKSRGQRVNEEIDELARREFRKNSS